MNHSNSQCSFVPAVATHQCVGPKSLKLCSFTNNQFLASNNLISLQRRFRSTLQTTTPTLSLQPSVPTKSDTAEKSKALETWLVDNGMYLSPVATWGSPKHPLVIANETTDDGEDSGRGLIASKSILQNECLFEVPYEVIISKEAALKHIPELDDTVNEYVAISIFLISEREKGDKSFWAPYIDILPDDDKLIPLFRWTEEDRALLAGSPTLVAAESLSDKLRNEFQTVDKLYFQPNPDRFPSHIFNYQNWEWAFAILFSRAISLTKGKIIALVPYADLLNHNPFCSNYIDVHREMLTGDRFVRLYSDRPYSITDQVFVTYGPKPNADLLLLYGFVSDRNPYDSVDLIVSLDEADPLYDRKREYLEESGVEETTSFPLYRDRYPMEMVEFLRFCFATDEEFATADFGDFISERNETLVAQAIIDACSKALKNYPQSREDDDALMRDMRMFQSLSQKQRWAIRQRRAEKMILERTITTIESEMVDPKFMFTETQ